jgi:AcrR family transcriptional regulator
VTFRSVADVEPCARKGRPRDERLDEVITEAAVAVLADVGFDRFSVEAVAQRAGVAKTTVYRRFASRDDLIAGALSHLDEEAEVSLSDGPVRSRLIALLSAIRESTPHSDRGRILMHAMGLQDARLAELVYDRVLSSRAARLRSVILDGMASSELAGDLDVDTVTAALVGPMLYLRMWRMREAVERVSVDDVVDLIMCGLIRANGS